MTGSLGLFDRVDLTAHSESSSRNGERVDTLQIHHATTFNYGALRSLMAPGGRTVSANGALDKDGTLYEVVELGRRAFTSATGFDRRCLTVETVNTSGAPTWGISDESRERLARLAVAMYRAGVLGGFHRGPGGIIGHSEVPGTYATACPGPDMRLDWIAERARTLNAGATSGSFTPIEENTLAALNDDQFAALMKAVDNINNPGYGVQARVRELMYAIDGKGDPNVRDAAGNSVGTVTRELARFLQNPSNIDTAELAREISANIKVEGASAEQIEQAVDAAFARVFVAA